MNRGSIKCLSRMRGGDPDTFRCDKNEGVFPACAGVILKLAIH